jgi:hypothetical protein
MEKIILTAAEAKILNAFRAGPKDTRAALECVHVASGGKIIEATDGRALLRVIPGEPLGVPDGVYKIVAVNKSVAPGMMEVVLDETIDMQFPDTERVIPAISRADETCSVEIVLDKKCPTNMTACALKLYRLSGGAYSIHLMERLAPLGAIWTASKPKDAAAPVRLDCMKGERGYIAVIMPFRLPE